MLTIKITGGLGNQLFKIISALGFCEKYNKKLILSKTNIINNPIFNCSNSILIEYGLRFLIGNE